MAIVALFDLLPGGLQVGEPPCHRVEVQTFDRRHRRVERSPVGALAGRIFHAEGEQDPRPTFELNVAILFVKGFVGPPGKHSEFASGQAGEVVVVGLVSVLARLAGVAVPVTDVLFDRPHRGHLPQVSKRCDSRGPRFGPCGVDRFDQRFEVGDVAFFALVDFEFGPVPWNYVGSVFALIEMLGFRIE